MLTPKSESGVAWLTLFTSSSTLVCCTLPALLIALGAGSTLAALISAVPQLVWISNHKILVFGGSAILLALGGYMQMQPAACPADKALALACARSKKFSRVLYLASLAVYLTGVWFAFAWPWLKQLTR